MAEDPHHDQLHLRLFPHSETGQEGGSYIVRQSSPSKINIMKVEASDEHREVDPMHKILSENRQKKFNERKKELLKQFEDMPTSKTKRSLSPTT